MGEDRENRLTCWVEWYRFARERLDYSEAEAVSYANLRAVEDENRERLRKCKTA